MIPGGYSRGSPFRPVRDLLGKETSDGLIEQLAATLAQFPIDTDTAQIRRESCWRILCLRKIWARRYDRSCKPGRAILVARKWRIE
jgi:hypothetical protein